MELAVERFEPVYLRLEDAKVSEYGKRFFDDRLAQFERFNATIKDVIKLAHKQVWKWPRIQAQLDAEGVPQAISSGISQYAMPKLIDHLDGKTSFTMPATVAMGLATAAPSSTTTGATFSESAYTGYGRQTLAGAAFNAATAATPSVSTNASTITFGNCTALTSTLLGFGLFDSATVSAGNMLWYGTLTSVTISTTQTPPTVAAAAMSLSMTGT